MDSNIRIGVGKIMRSSILVLLLLQTVAAQKWNTLKRIGFGGALEGVGQLYGRLGVGQSPIIIARSGFSGLYPESSEFAYEFALSVSLPGITLFCDLQLAKDNNGFCRDDLKLDNSTNISLVYPKGDNTYTVNGKPLHGWFALDFTSKQLLGNITVNQNIYTRPSVFDNLAPMYTLQDVIALRPPFLWVNVQYDSFYKQHNLSMATYIMSVLKSMTIDYISSTEVGFLQSISAFVTPKTKLVFSFLKPDAVEPTTNSTYGSMLFKMPFIKTFASGILVPKEYVWPVDEDGYLQPATTIVSDDHKLGLQVHASGFANDIPTTYNYSYDPLKEYFQFVDGGDFSVDGFLTDFPSTASEALSCMRTQGASPGNGKPLVITHFGASGLYAGCTDLAYQQAVNDGADIIDCPVQMTKDGVPICMSSVDLMVGTTAVSSFMPRARTIPEIQSKNGIFTFDLTLKEIQSLTPELASPFDSVSGLKRNPAYKNQGTFLTLADFLSYAKEKKVAGILIDVKHAFYQQSKGLPVTDTVIKALHNANFDTHTAQKVLIQSDDSAVLNKFKQQTSYSHVFAIDESIRGISTPAINKIKEFADAVTVSRTSTMTNSGFFISTFTDVVQKMHASNIFVYVSVLQNEYIALAFDFLADPSVEIATLVSSLHVDGLVTEFPATASNYFKSSCYNGNAKYTILAIKPGYLLESASSDALPPATAPAPMFDVDDVVDPPLPAVSGGSLPDGNATTAPENSTHPSGQTTNGINIELFLFMLTFSITKLGIICGL